MQLGEQHAGCCGRQGKVLFDKNCGVPLLLVPQQEEQTFNARRVVELGAGQMIHKGQVTAQTLRSMSEQLLAESRFNAEANRVGDTFRAAGGAPRAADEIGSMLENSKM